MKKLQQAMTAGQYARHAGMKCPMGCEGGDFDGEGISIESGGASQEVSCRECGANWTDEYKLVGYSLLFDGKGAPVDIPDGGPEIHQLLVLSLGHIVRDGGASALASLTADGSRSAGPNCYSDEYPYGYHLTLAPIEEDAEPEEYASPSLKRVVEYAREIGCTHVRLDVDGPTVPELSEPVKEPYTVILDLQDGSGGTWMGHVHEIGPQNACNAALRQLAEERLIVQSENGIIEPNQGETVESTILKQTAFYSVIACIAGEHNDLKP